MAKLMDKIGMYTDPLPSSSGFDQFDVDLVMKKACTTGKLLSKRSRAMSNVKQISPKKFVKVAALDLTPIKQSGQENHDSQPFMDLCLSPMGSQSSSQETKQTIRR